MELMIPAPNWKFLCLALDNGADAVYLPVQGLVTISYKGLIFRQEEIKHIINLVHIQGKKAYVVFNAKLPRHQYENIFKAIRETVCYKPDGIVLGDYNIMSWAADNFGDQRIEIIASKTLDIQSGRDVRFASLMGADRIIIDWPGLKKIKSFEQDPKLGIDILLENLDDTQDFPFEKLASNSMIKGIKIVPPGDLKNAGYIIRQFREIIDRTMVNSKEPLLVSNEIL